MEFSLIGVSQLVSRCPSKWFTGTIGLSHQNASAFAKLTPTHNAGSKPGPFTTAIKSISGASYFRRKGAIFLYNSGSRSKISLTIFNRAAAFLVLDQAGLAAIGNPASFSAARKTEMRLRWCSLFASIGTTPPHFLWIFTCEETTFDKILKVPFFTSKTAIAVSSQDVSIPNIFISLAP